MKILFSLPEHGVCRQSLVMGVYEYVHVTWCPVVPVAVVSVLCLNTTHHTLLSLA